VSELSLNEVEALAAKVARGAGFSWGLAEEIGKGARALARGGHPWAEAMLTLARDAGTWLAPSKSCVEAWRTLAYESGVSEPLCPVRVAAVLIDDHSILDARPLRIANVGAPLWIVALFAASGIHEYDVEGAGVSIADVKISLRGAPPAIVPACRRAHAGDASLAALNAVAARIYVPASEISRATGAGGGSVDDE
jgi:hypothetical protein